VLPRAARRPIYDAEIIAGVAFCWAVPGLAFGWAVLGASTGQRLTPIMADLVPRLRRFQELVATDDAEPALLATSPASLDRRLAPDRAKLLVRGRSHTKPGSLLKERIPIRTWAEWNDAVPGFVEIDLVGHEVGEHHPRRHLRRAESRGRPPRGEVQALTEQLLTVTTSKKGPGCNHPPRSPYARIHRWVNDPGYRAC